LALAAAAERGIKFWLRQALAMSPGVKDIGARPAYSIFIHHFTAPWRMRILEVEWVMTMRRFPRVLRGARSGVVACLVASMSATAPAIADDVIEVQIDQAKIIQLPEKTSTIIIGNPIVADVTLLKGSGNMVLTGKGFGETNLIALDNRGNSLGESIIRVKTGFKGLVVQRGSDRESYSCLPRCQPVVVLGDTPKFVGETGSQIQAHSALAGAAGPTK
jgi:Pilus formation protein N terminal region